jgi:hypothetical protein
MDAYIVEDFIAIDNGRAALFFEYDVVNALFPERARSIWQANFEHLRRQHYSLLVFDNFGHQMASCTSDSYRIIQELTAYIEDQFRHSSVHVYYLDIWAFPPEMESIFTDLRDRRSAVLPQTLNSVVSEGEPLPIEPKVKPRTIFARLQSLVSRGYRA